MDQSSQSATGHVFSANPGPVIPNEEVQNEMAAEAQKFDAARKEAAAEKANQSGQKDEDKKDAKESKSD